MRENNNNTGEEMNESITEESNAEIDAPENTEMNDNTTDLKNDDDAEVEKTADEKDENLTADNEVEELKEKLKESQEKEKENYDRLLRLSAEFENYKKRSSREMSDFRKFANEALIRELLAVVDNLERAIQSTETEKQNSESIVEGIEMTLKEILRIFEKFGVKPIESFEKSFDPNYHQAVMREESDAYSENTVLRELQKGYLLHDRLLRPAMVVVTAPVATDKKDNEEKDSQE